MAPARLLDCAVIGGGPAGLAATLYLARFGRTTALFEAGPPRVRWAPRLRNLLGFPRGIPGTGLLRRFDRHLGRYRGVRRVRERAQIRRLAGGFAIATPSGKVYFARKVILAVGVNDVHPRVGNLGALRRRGLLRYCSICDGFEMRGKRVAVFVGRASDVPKALFIATWTRRIVIFGPPSLRVSPADRERIAERAIEVVRAKAFRIRPAPSGRAIEILADGRSAETYAVAYVELGCRVNDDAYRGLRGLRKSPEGFIEATAEQRTSIPGLFAIGDCVNRLGQVSVALGQAAVAATNVHNELSP